MSPRPRRVLFVFAWLVVGGEETEVRLLAEHLDPARWRLDVVACLRKPGMPEQTHEQLAALGVDVDTAPYQLSFTDTVAHLAEKMGAYDLVVACQAVPDVLPALDAMRAPPPLIEHGGLVEEALRGSRRRTARYIGVCDAIRSAAASRMPDRPHHAVEIPSMVDLSAFASPDREGVRREFGLAPDAPVVGWVGRLDRKKHVEDFVRAAALVRAVRDDARFLVVGGPDAFMPDYADELRALAGALGLSDALLFTGDRPDVARLLSGLDVFCWLSRGEGMPHVVAEAGAAGLPVVATRDDGSAQQIEDGVSGVFTPHEDPAAVAGAVLRLLGDRALARRMGDRLRSDVASRYDARTVTRAWEAVFDEVLQEPRRDEADQQAALSPARS